MYTIYAGSAFIYTCLCLKVTTSQNATDTVAIEEIAAKDECRRIE